MTSSSDQPAEALTLVDLKAGIERASFLRVKDQLELGNWKVMAEGASPTAIQQGEPWPSRQGTLVFERHTVTVPPEWPLDQVRLELDMGGRGQAWMHSKFGRVHHDIGPRLPGLQVPALAFGLRAEVVAEPSDAGSAPMPLMGQTRLVLVDEAADTLHRGLQDLELQVEKMGLTRETSARLRRLLDELAAGYGHPTPTSS